METVYCNVFMWWGLSSEKGVMVKAGGLFFHVLNSSSISKSICDYQHFAACFPLVLWYCTFSFLMLCTHACTHTHTCAHTNTQSAFASQHKALARCFKAYCISLTGFRCSHFPFLKCPASTHLTFFRVLLWINSLTLVALQQPLLATDSLQCAWPFSVGLVNAET